MGLPKRGLMKKKKRLFVCDDSRVLKVYLLPRKRSSPLMCNDRRSETQQKKNKHSMKALVEIRERTTPTTVLQRTEIASLRLIFFFMPGSLAAGEERWLFHSTNAEGSSGCLRVKSCLAMLACDVSLGNKLRAQKQSHVRMQRTPDSLYVAQKTKKRRYERGRKQLL